MSTKTSFKRIALVAASALAIAGFSAVPANAASDALTTTSTLATATITVAAGSTATTTFTVTTTGVTTSATTTWTAAVGAGAPAGSTATPIITAATGTNAKFTFAVATPTTFTAATAGKTGAASAAEGGATISFTPLLPGTYPITIIGDGVSHATTTLTVIATSNNATAGTISSISLAKGSAVASTVGTAVKVNTGLVATVQTTAGVVTHLIGYISAAPSNGMVTVGSATQLGDGATTGTLDLSTNASTAVTAVGGKLVITGDPTDIFHGGISVTASATAGVATSGIGSFQFTPTKGGTYTLTVFNDANEDGLLSPNEAVQTLDVTVAAASALAAGAAIVRQAPPATPVAATTLTSTGDVNYTTALDAATYSAAKGTVAAPSNISNIEVILLNANGSAAGQGNTVSATVSGSGLVLLNQTAAATPGTKRTDSLPTLGTTNVIVAHIGTDGTSGPGSVTISVTDAVTGVTTVLATKSFISTGSVSTLKVVSTNANIGKAGATTGGAVTSRTALLEGQTAAGVTAGNGSVLTATTSIPAFVVATTDGTNPASIAAGASPTVSSSDATVVSSATCAKDDGAGLANLVTTQGGADGFYNCKFITAANAVSGKSATLTVKTTNPADATGLTFLTDTFVVTVGGSIATEAITTDATSYAPGSAMVVTVTAKDSAGNPVADGLASPALTANKALGATAVALATSFYKGGKVANATSTATSTTFAPPLGGDFMITGTSGNAAGSTITVTASVEGDQSSSLALDAANAATDAANNAYDEAQNATQAASDALAAVTALSAQVGDLIATVKSLAAVVAKIKAKVKA